MVKRTDINISREKTSEHAFARSRSNKKETQPADDIIMSLSNAHENRRAQQVQPRNIHLAA
jgi:hypothetical protein